MVQLRFLIIATIFPFLLSVPKEASSQDFTFIEYDDTPGLVRFIRIFTIDDVKDNCWTNARAVEASTRLFFEREGIGVLQEEPAFYSPAVMQLYIEAIGFRQVNGICASSLSIQAGRPSSDSWGGSTDNNEYSISVWNELFQRRFVMTNGANNDSQISNNVDEVITAFMADVLSSRRSDTVKRFFDDFPRLKEEPLSKEEFRELLSTSRSE